MELKTSFDRPIFAADAKRHYKEWFHPKTGEKKEFRVLLSVVVNALDPAGFDEAYDQVMEELFASYSIKRTRAVYSASDLGSLLGPGDAKLKSFALNFARKMWAVPKTKYTYVVTRINAGALKARGNSKITIHGEYGSPTKDISIPEFLDEIYPYHNVLSMWHVAERLQINNAYCLLDGVDTIARSVAWENLVQRQRPQIVNNGDRIVPAISTSDILLRSMDSFLSGTRRLIDEDTMRDIATAHGTISLPNVYFEYMGNPHLQRIKPLSSQKLGTYELSSYYRHPIFFIGTGNHPAARLTFEGSPGFEKVLKMASGLAGSVRFYDAKKDKSIIGRGESEDYFVPLNDHARIDLQTLMASGWRVREFKL